MSARLSPPVEVRLALSPRLYFLLRDRAQSLSRSPEDEAGRLLRYVILALVSGEALKRPFFTQADVDRIAENERKRARRWYEEELTKLRAGSPE